MFKNYFKIAWRNLARNKIYAAINITGLALGISTCLVIFLVTRFELSFENFRPDRDRIYRVTATIDAPMHDRHYLPGLPHPAPDAIRQELTGFEQLAVFHNYHAKVSIPAGSQAVRKFDARDWGSSDLVIAEPQYFDIFHYRWLAGHPATALQEPFKVVLTESKAYKYFGRQPLDRMLGKTVIYNDSLRVTVSGIVKDPARNTDFYFNDFISAATVPHSFLKNDFTYGQWGNFHTESQTFVRLSKGTPASRLYAQFPAFIQRHIKLPPTDKVNFALQPLSDLHFNSNYSDGYSRQAHLPTLYGLMGIALFILLIAAINFINLSTAQSIERGREIGVRKVLGSSRSGLVWQFLSETLLFTLLAMALSLLLLKPIMQLFQSHIPNGAGLELLSPSTLLFLLLLAVATALLAGLYPARVLSASLPALVLKGASMQKGNRRGYLRKGLIVFQFTISLVFIIGTLVVGRQLRFMQQKDMGFDKDAIVNLEVSRDYPNSKRDALVEKVRQLPGVHMASISSSTPAAKRHWGTRIKYRGKEEVEIDIHLQWCDAQFIPLYQLKLLAGRNLLPSDTMREFVINAACARALGFANPADAVGKIIESGMSDGSPRNCPVVGVLEDYHEQSLHEPIKPVLFTASKAAARTVSIKLLTQGRQMARFRQTIAQLEKIWQEIYPNEKFEYAFFDDTIAKLYEKDRQSARLMNTAMIISIFISCMGLFGLAAFTARRRTKEIGIRKVLGASVANITAMLTRDFVLLVLIAMVAATPLAWYFMHRWLENFAYRVSLSWWIFALAGLTAVLIALATVSLQAIRAAVVNPAKSLRTE